jgi:hypothetical protein
MKQVSRTMTSFLRGLLPDLRKSCRACNGLRPELMRAPWVAVWPSGHFLATPLHPIFIERPRRSNDPTISQPRRPHHRRITRDRRRDCAPPRLRRRVCRLYLFIVGETGAGIGFRSGGSRRNCIRDQRPTVQFPRRYGCGGRPRCGALRVPPTHSERQVCAPPA